MQWVHFRSYALYLKPPPCSFFLYGDMPPKMWDILQRPIGDKAAYEKISTKQILWDRINQALRHYFSTQPVASLGSTPGNTMRVTKITIIAKITKTF